MGMAMALIWSGGVVARGHRVASGRGGDARFPHGTIAPQLPAFRRIVPGFDLHLGGAAHPGTINVRLLGGDMLLGEPEHRTGPVRWTEVFPPESFLLSRCLLRHRGVERPAFLYVPDPATKPDHHQPGDVIELLAPLVPGLRYGDAVAIGRAPGIFTVATPTPASPAVD